MNIAASPQIHENRSANLQPLFMVVQVIFGHDRHVAPVPLSDDRRVAEGDGIRLELCADVLPGAEGRAIDKRSPATSAIFEP